MTARVVALAGLALVVSCGQDRTEVDVFAASSLTDAFSELETRFESGHPTIDVRLNLAGSNVLLRQINDGAEADVYAPADIRLFTDLDAEPHAFASNTLVAIVPASSSAQSVGELVDQTLARCASGVPCGDATDMWLQDAGLELSRASSEANVRSVLTKVRLGEADGGFVYRTDALAAGDQVRIIELDDAPVVDLGIAALSDSDASEAFVHFIQSDEAAEVFAELGFDRP